MIIINYITKKQQQIIANPPRSGFKLILLHGSIMFHHPWTILDYSGLTFPKAGTPACTFGTLGRTMRSKMDVSPSGVWPVAVVPWRQVLRSAMVGIAGLSSAGRSCLKSVKKHGNLWNQSQKLGYWNLKLEFKNHQDLWYPMSQ